MSIVYPVTVTEFLNDGAYGERFVCKTTSELSDVLAFLSEEGSTYSVEDVNAKAVPVRLVAL